ncbi:MAG: hypothetical protein KAI70_05845 [Candidatus Omnitrophica bacterium]|nr:hypothetical protein [Candidatus Omnitrophota bacterium]
MSIITKALEKAQKERFATQDKTDDPITLTSVSSPIKPPEKKKKNRVFRMFVIMTISILFCGLIAFFFITDQVTVQNNIVQTPLLGTKNLPAEQVPALDPVEIELPPAPAKQEKTIHLKKIEPPHALPEVNGIMYSPTAPLTVLNGIIFSEGEKLEGFTVSRILPHSVIVTKNGKESELKLK